MTIRACRIYIAGPMRGYPELNFPAFHDAADRFRRAGYIVRNPVEIGMEAFGPNPEAVSPGEFLREDIRIVLDCDAMALLPGWDKSTGAKCEAVVARTLGLTFYDAVTMQEIDPPSRIEIGSGYEAPPDLSALASSRTGGQQT